MVLTEKALTKANSKVYHFYVVSYDEFHFVLQSNLKKLVEYINSGSVKKLEKILEAGLDPNFIMEDGSKFNILYNIAVDRFLIQIHP